MRASATDTIRSHSPSVTCGRARRGSASRNSSGSSAGRIPTVTSDTRSRLSRSRQREAAAAGSAATSSRIASLPSGRAVPGFHSPDPALLYSTVTGDPGGAGYFPMNAVRWLTPSREIAALVTQSGKDRFQAEVFHFGEEQRPMGAELYLLEPGTYTLRVAPLAGGEPLTRTTIRVEGPRTQVSFSLPSRRSCRLDVRR